MHWLLRDMLIGVALYIVVEFALYSFQRKLIYHPYDSDTKIYGETLEVVTSDNRKQYTTYIKPNTKNTTLVWFHGNAINHKDSISLVEPYLQAGYGILFIEYPGFAGNSGAPSETLIYENSRAFINILIERGESVENLVFYGQSIGSGPAIQMATEYDGIKALVLEAPFTSLYDMGKRLLPIFPIRLMLKDRYNNIEKIQSIKVPTFFMHGTEDRTISELHSKKLFYKSGAEIKEVFLIQGAGHNNLPLYKIADHVMKVLDKHFPE